MINYWAIAVIVTGIVFIISGPLVNLSIKNNVKNNLHDSYILTTTNSLNFDYIDTYNVILYAYNVTNIFDIINGSQPLFEIIGPYFYDYTLITNNANFTDNENTFTFTRNYYYNPLGNNSSVDKLTNLQLGYFDTIYLLGNGYESVLPSC